MKKKLTKTELIEKRKKLADKCLEKWDYRKDDYDYTQKIMDFCEFCNDSSPKLLKIDCNNCICPEILCFRANSGLIRTINNLTNSKFIIKADSFSVDLMIKALKQIKQSGVIKENTKIMIKEYIGIFEGVVKI